ncbi:GntR family transcriptional regulator [uncultured Boseongicola sp.]|jgi:DNA-binding GntR family transcriptional regulator|uniref:GntR family transcriptional regulator n=1 Tax=uncultured Boseongicola sp. TaxID=1648499 RepID=UPI002610ABDA|nr:GntR family transcriptional regulator [uncultured Boseongicola sp.]
MSSDLMRHRIFEELREDIMSCDLQPGEELREVALAEKYGVSKSPIRDALQRLEFEGLIEIAPRQGHRIAPISISDAHDILDLREILETAMARRIAADASIENLAALDDFRTADLSSLPEFARYNRNFHAKINELSGNRRHADTMRSLMDNYERLCIVSLSSRHQEANAMQSALDDHNKIIDALQSRDGRAAARLCAKHIRKSHVQVMRGLKNRPVIE